MIPAWSAFNAIADGDSPITPSDIAAHCDLCEITDPRIRHLIYRGVIALRSELLAWQNEMADLKG